MKALLKLNYNYRQIPYADVFARKKKELKPTSHIPDLI